MPLLPTRTYSDQAAANILLEVKKGERKALGEFIWQHQERFYSIAFLATNDTESASKLTIQAFKNACAAVRQMNAKQLQSQPNVWEWLAQFIVDEVADWHNGSPQRTPAEPPATDPTVDGSATMDWETTVILGAQRVKRCINSLPPEQKDAFVLRHQLGLSFKQVVAVLNQNPDNVMANLHRGRVQVVKCLGRG
ncbi:MAG TPA: sigma-70 family RNA polymerase sigma factor [Candidatus Obscuribacterales bacterium]